MPFVAKLLEEKVLEADAISFKLRQPLEFCVSQPGFASAVRGLRQPFHQLQGLDTVRLVWIG
jgi:hypothetical protein